MPLITLVTDYGTKDFFLGSLKGNIYSFCKNPLLVDITHEITRHGLIQAAYVLKSTFPHFPKGTFHLLLTDTEIDNARPVLFEYKEHYFLGIDNGVFNIALNGDVPSWIIELEAEKLGLEDNNNLNIFFAAVLGALTNGTNPKELGTLGKKLIATEASVPQYGSWGIRGEVIYIDSYENVVLNIERNLFEEQFKDKKFKIEFRSLDKIEKISKGYSDVHAGEFLAFFNDTDYLELAINHGKAASLFGLKLKNIVQIDTQ